MGTSHRNSASQPAILQPVPPEAALALSIIESALSVVNGARERCATTCKSAVQQAAMLTDGESSDRRIRTQHEGSTMSPPQVAAQATDVYACVSWHIARRVAAVLSDHDMCVIFGVTGPQTLVSETMNAWHGIAAQVQYAPLVQFCGVKCKTGRLLGIMAGCV